MTDVEWTAKFVHFLQQYHEEDLQELVQNPDDPVLALSLHDLDRVAGAIVDDLQQHPETILPQMEWIVQHYATAAEEAYYADTEYPVELVSHDPPEDTVVSFCDAPKRYYIDIGEPRSEYIGQFIAIEGICQQISDPKPRILEAVFKCQICGTTTAMDVSETFDLEGATPERCPDCEKRAFERAPAQEDRIEFQQLRVQESPEDAHNATSPREILLNVHGRVLIDECTDGDRITVLGVLEEDRDTESTLVPTRIESGAIIPEEQAFEDMEISADEKEKIEELAGSPEIYDLLEASIAPTIEGNEMVKRALALQMFGGVTRHRYGNRKRGQIHILCIGDPGTSKSQLLDNVRDIAPRAIGAEGTSSSSAGLTASAQKESIGGEEQWTLRAGALALADGGLITIDELDKMREDEQKALTSALSDGSFRVDKANIHTELNARCSALVAANPVEGRFNPHDSYHEQFNLPEELLNRFDLRFIFEDAPDEDLDALIASAVLEPHQESAVAAADGGYAAVDDRGVIDYALLRKYIAYARGKFSPTVTEDASEKLKEWYVRIRGLSSENQVATNPRELEGARRLSEASARARLSDTVAVEDVNRAIDLVMASKNQTQLDEEEGYDVDRVESGRDAPSQRKRINRIKAIIRDADDDNGGSGAPHEDVAAMADSFDINADQLDHDLEKLKNKGEVYEPSSDHYKLT